MAVAMALFSVETFINYLCIWCVSYIHLPWKNGAKYSYARIGPNPLYWPTNNSEKNIGNPIINTIKIYGTKNAPARGWCYAYIYVCVWDILRNACQEREKKKFKCIVMSKRQNICTHSIVYDNMKKRSIYKTSSKYVLGQMKNYWHEIEGE